MSSISIALPFESYIEVAAGMFTSITFGYIANIATEVFIEYFKYPLNYNHSSNLLLKILCHFDLNKAALISISFSTICTFFFNYKLCNPCCLIVAVLTWFFLRINFDKCTHSYKKFLRADLGLDYGSGMASSYFHGFLNIVLPEDNQGHGFLERIVNFEEGHKVKVAVHKLIILIPHTLRSEKEFQDHWVEKSSQIETVYCNRAGVSSRPYTVGVYRFKNKLRRTEYHSPEDFYVIAECATPLLSFYEAIYKSKVTSTPYMEALKLEIAKKFCKSLKKYVESTPETRGLVEVVYFNDEYQKAGEVLECAVKNIWQREDTGV